jgi:hypothetical protein
LLSDQEEQGMAGEARLSKGDFANIDGWSRRGINATRAGRDHNQAEFSIDLGGQINILVGEGNPVTVDLVRPDHTPERVWYHEQGTRRVSAAEYQRVFRPTN